VGSDARNAFAADIPGHKREMGDVSIPSVRCGSRFVPPNPGRQGGASERATMADFIGTTALNRQEVPMVYVQDLEM